MADPVVDKGTLLTGGEISADKTRSFSRRDFLKLGGLGAFALLLRRVAPLLNTEMKTGGGIQGRYANW